MGQRNAGNRGIRAWLSLKKNLTGRMTRQGRTQVGSQKEPDRAKKNGRQGTGGQARGTTKCGQPKYKRSSDLKRPTIPVHTPNRNKRRGQGVNGQSKRAEQEGKKRGHDTGGEWGPDRENESGATVSSQIETGRSTQVRVTGGMG